MPQMTKSTNQRIRMATKEAKPDGQFYLSPETAMRHMGPLPVEVRFLDISHRSLFVLSQDIAIYIKRLNQSHLQVVIFAVKLKL